MMQERRISPRAEYRLLQSERVNASASLAETFPRLKSLLVELEFFNAAGVTRNGGLKFKANIERANSLMRFNCASGECTGGDYDLSEELAHAISAEKTIVTGEMRCQGMRQNMGKSERGPCGNLLRYTLHLTYLQAQPKRAGRLSGAPLLKAPSV